MRLIRGDRLTTEQRKQVLNAFGYRWTHENAKRSMNWSGIQGKPTIALQSDDEWLRDYAFYFIQDGSRLARNRRYCEPAFMAD